MSQQNPLVVSWMCDYKMKFVLEPYQGNKNYTSKPVLNSNLESIGVRAMECKRTDALDLEKLLSIETRSDPLTLTRFQIEHRRNGIENVYHRVVLRME